MIAHDMACHMKQTKSDIKVFTNNMLPWKLCLFSLKSVKYLRIWI